MLRHVKMRPSIKNKPTNNQERVGEQHSNMTWRSGEIRKFRDYCYSVPWRGGWESNTKIDHGVKEGNKMQMLRGDHSLLKEMDRVR